MDTTAVQFSYTWTEVKIQSTTVTKSQGPQTAKACWGEEQKVTGSGRSRLRTTKHTSSDSRDEWSVHYFLATVFKRSKSSNWYKHFHIYNANRRHGRDVPQLVRSSTRKGRESGLSPPHTSREHRRGTPVFSLHSKRLFWVSSDEVERVPETCQSTEYFRVMSVACYSLLFVFFLYIYFFLGLFLLRQVDWPITRSVSSSLLGRCHPEGKQNFVIVWKSRLFRFVSTFGVMEFLLR